jgi:hypothetical protein
LLATFQQIDRDFPVQYNLRSRPAKLRESDRPTLLEMPVRELVLNRTDLAVRATDSWASNKPMAFARPQHLAAEQMKVLRGGGRVDDLQVVFGSQGQKPFDAGATMLGACPLKAMRQEHRDSAEPAPFVFGAGDELIDDDLRHVPEIAKLGLPANERFGMIQAVAVLKAKHADFGQRAVDDFDAGLIVGDVLQRNVRFAVFDVV